jgi:hypothetical protein
MGRVRDAGNKSFGSVLISDFAALLDEEIITIGDPLNGGKVFEWDDDAAVAVVGAVAVEIGANDAECIENLRDAINAEMPSKLLAYVDPVNTDVLRIEAVNEGDLGNLDFTTDMGDAGNIIAATADKLAGGSNDGNRSRASDTYVVTAVDVAAGNIMIPTPFAAPTLGCIRVVTSADVPKYFTAKPTISAGRVKITEQGATALVAGDKIYWEVFSAE